LNVNDAPVVVTAISNMSATQATLFEADIKAHLSDPDTDTLVFSASGLPDGFSISAAGVISGTASNTVALAGPLHRNRYRKRSFEPDGEQQLCADRAERERHPRGNRSH